MNRIPAPVVDHVVVNVKDQLDEAADLYRKPGFVLTARGHHSLGSTSGPPRRSAATARR